jgi:2-polyprenyl-3-methyl-5-hydroxy-6-metoxy-1,4-benzoquinol methylase
VGSYPKQAKSYVALAKRYEALSRLNFSEHEIWTKLHELKNGSSSPLRERAAIPTDFDQISQDRVARYRFAASLLQNGKRVLHLHHGQSFGSWLMAECGAKVDSIEFYSAELQDPALIWAHPDVTFRSASIASALGGVSHAYDVIVAFDVPERIYDLKQFLSQSWRCLAPGGLVFLSTPDPDRCRPSIDPGVVHRPTVEEMIELLTALPDAAEWICVRQVGIEIGRERAGPADLVAVSMKVDEPRLSGSLQSLLPFRAPPTPGRRRWHLAANAFRSPLTERVDQAIELDFALTDGHLVYGPYLTFPAGSYRVAFVLEAVTGSRSGSGTLTFDVNAEGDETLGRAAMSGVRLLSEIGKAREIRLDFEHADPGKKLEFRIHAAGMVLLGALLFRGALLEKKS